MIELVLPLADGGGIRGLSELHILEELMNRIKVQEELSRVPKPCEYFDLIGGTDTGGIIAIFLGRLGMSIEKAIEEYNNLARKVFSNRKNSWKDEAFKASVLEAVMKDIVAKYNRIEDKDALMRDNRDQGCRTEHELNLNILSFVCAIPALNMAHPRLFRSYVVRESQEYDATIWEVARATTAAPGFFKSIYIGTEPKEEFIDSGLKCNNPTKEVFMEAQKVFGTKRPISCILSIGTGHPNAISLREPSMLQRSDLMDALLGIAQDCEKVSNEFEEEYGKSYKRGSRKVKKAYFRLNVQQGLQNVSLTEWTKMGEVKTHTLSYLEDAAVSAEVDRVIDVLETRRVWPKMLARTLSAFLQCG
ncbi:hypothetical protein C0992_006445 [Termitomyces sp. T32_za158]|nr:hypothetical protein C0992_006445 [Termitomyces sp. T32_za158]